MRPLVVRRPFAHEAVQGPVAGTDAHPRRRKQRVATRTLSFVVAGVVALLFFCCIFHGMLSSAHTRSVRAVGASTEPKDEKLRRQGQWTDTPRAPAAEKRTSSSTTITGANKTSVSSSLPPPALPVGGVPPAAPDALLHPRSKTSAEPPASGSLAPFEASGTAHHAQATAPTRIVTAGLHPAPAPPWVHRLPPQSSPTIRRPNLPGAQAQYLPEKPQLLPGLQIRRRTFTPAELLERFGDTDIIYSFVNGSEANHYYRKAMRLSCMEEILAVESTSYAKGHTFLTPRPNPAETPTTSFTRAPANPFEAVYRSLHCAPEFLRSTQNPIRTTNDVLQAVEAAARHGADNRDRETDELRHSLRSVEQHVRWHRGRVVMVSPGHHPTWVDGAKNFLAGMCGGARVQALRSSGTHLRVTTVHQDAVMPYGMRLTVDSHVIEQHLWRVRNVTPVHVYMNDDYFVNRDVAITDLLNEYGGTIVRTEGPSVAEGRRGDVSASWVEGVANTELFNVYHLEHLPEDFLPRPLLDSWTRLLKRSAPETQSASNGLMSFLKWKLSEILAPARRRGAGTTDGGGDDAAARAEFEQEARYILDFSDLLSAANTSSYWEAALSNPITPTSLPSGRHKGVQKHYYATHAPFVYCTNMFRHWSVRFRDEFADLQLHHRERRARDLFVPFLYNAFIMARPWQASPKFLPYLVELKEAMEAAAADAKAVLSRLRQTKTVSLIDALREEFQKHLAKYVPTVSIFLDNDDGCAPATLYRNPAAEVMYMRATNNIEENKRVMDDVVRQDPLYFNINAGFSSAEAAGQLRRFLHGKFPTPVYLEVGGAPPPGEGLVDGAVEVVGGRTRAAGAAAAAEEGALSRLFGDLMALPVVGVVSYEEGVCPLVRSLALAFAGHHRGGVRVSVEQHGGATLREARAALGHRVVSAMPAPACAYKEQVSVDPAARGESVAAIARRAMGEMRGGVELPWTCGGGGAGLRVRGFVVDARTRGAPVRSAAALRDALAVPAQTLSLEDFRAVAVGPSEGDVVLVVSREDAEAKAVHWVNGASESDLLVTYPLPVEAYEDMDAEVRCPVMETIIRMPVCVPVACERGRQRHCGTISLAR